MRWVAIGDSNTFGQGIARTDAWTTLLADDLRDEVINKGVCGDTTRLGLERFPRDVQQLQPDAVIVQFGMNDANRWESDRGLPRVSPQAFQANLNEMIHRCRTFDIGTIILCTITRSVRSAQLSRDSEIYSQFIRRTARAWGVGIFDAEQAVEPGHLLDLVHLDEEGHRIYADGLVGALGC